MLYLPDKIGRFYQPTKLPDFCRATLSADKNGQFYRSSDIPFTLILRTCVHYYVGPYERQTLKRGSGTDTSFQERISSQKEFYIDKKIFHYILS